MEIYQNANQLISKFNRISFVDQVDYPYKIRELIPKQNLSRNSNFLKLLTQIYDDQSLEANLRFSAFYTHLVILWRIKEYTLYRDLVDLYENRFKDFALYLTFKAQYYSSRQTNEQNLRLAVEYSKKAAKKLPESPNVLYLFGEMVANLGDFQGALEKSLLNHAENLVSKSLAISKGKYAKYFATYARLLALSGNFNLAKENIQTAIDIEPSDNTEYSLRIAEYQSIKISISYLESSYKIEHKQSEALKTFDQLRHQMIELLGLLTAIMAFIITTVQIAQNYSLIESYKLIIIMGGVCIIIFSSFSILFIPNKLNLRHFIVITLGFLFIYFGIYLV